MQLENEAIKLILPDIASATYSTLAADIYKYTNQERFQSFSTADLYRNVLTELFKAHKQAPNIIYEAKNKPVFARNNKVLLCCSGGLDSVFQALFLSRERGYDITLLHLANANRYTNGQEEKVFIEFAEKFGFKYYIPRIVAKPDKAYKKFWQENSFKNFLIYSIAIDYMLADNIGILSSGDDLRLTVADQALGVNTGDCRELTTAFIDSFKLNFIPVDGKINKAERLKLLDKYNARDYYLSCVGPGRLIKAQHARYENRFNTKLDKWNCASCRKCCMHILLDKYYNNSSIPAELENRCWNILGDKNSADFVFFNKELSIETRIDNLINY